MRRRAARRGGLALVLAAVTACGSTVQQTGALGGGTAGGVAVPSGDGLSIAEGGVPGELGDAAVPGAPGTVDAPGAAGSAPGGPAGSVAAPGSPGGPAAAAPGAPGAPGAPAPAAGGRKGPGVSDKAVRIGFQYVDVGSGTGGVIGQDVSLGDPVQQAKAVAQHINKNGGMGGRQIELVPFGVPYSGYVNNPQNEYNRICSYFTQDEKVAAVAVYVPDETLIDCLAKKDVVSVADGYSMDRQVHQRYARHYYAPGSMSQDRGAEVGVAGLHAAGFFQGVQKIGVLRYDSGVYKRAAKSLDAALASKRLKADVTFEVSSANANSASSDISAAVLRFRSEGVSHVLVLDNSGGIATTFMTAAESQQYRPKYGLTTNNSPSAQRQLSPKEQLAGATAVSWWWGDVGPEEDQASPPALPPSKDVCLKIMRDAGADLSGRAAKGSALITCDQLLFLDTLFDKAPVPASEGLEAAADRLGTSYSSTLSYRTTIGPGRHDGATVTRIIRFASDCGCWRYAGPGPSA